MKRVEAPTLEEAYQKASEVLECSISELQYEVVQYPTKGLFGFFKRAAIIIATCKNNSSDWVAAEIKREEPLYIPTQEESVASEIIATLKENACRPEQVFVESKLENDSIVDSFFEVDLIYDDLAVMIEEQLKELFSHSCFEIDVVEVDIRDNTALIFIDGDDAALLIGKEGYRYNALSYMLFNWLHTKHELFIKLEIAEFLTTQQKMIHNYIKPLIENVEKTGRGKTRLLDGILVQIALEQLRERFPNKYVAVKKNREGKKFVIINEFNNKNKKHVS